MGKIKLSDIKNEIQKSGASKGKFMFFRPDSKARVRFLTDMEEGLEIKFHDSFTLGINVPCQEEFGRDCSYCENEDLRTRSMYVWCVYDYESKEVRLLMAATNNCSPVPALASLYETYGTLLDRDYEIKRIGSGQNTTYSVIPLDKVKFRNTKVKAMSEQAILKCIDKAYPADNSEDFGEEEEEKEVRKKKTKQTKGKAKTKVEEPEEDEWDDEEENKDYEEMNAKELYKLCKERDIDCKPRKSKEYYIDILEEADEENENDDWDDEDDEDWEE